MPEDEVTSTGNPAGYIRGLLSEGIGPTAGLRAFREAGGAIQDGRWFDLYGVVGDTAARVPASLALDPYNVPGPADFENWRMGKGGQYATQVEVTVRDRDTGDYFTKQHTYITDQPHTPAEAESDAFDVFGDPDSESTYGETVLGALAVNFYTTTPYS